MNKAELEFDPQAGALVENPVIVIPTDRHFFTLREIIELIVVALYPRDFRIYPDTASDGTPIQKVTARHMSRQSQIVAISQAVEEKTITPLSLLHRTPIQDSQRRIFDLDGFGLTVEALKEYFAGRGIAVAVKKVGRPRISVAEQGSVDELDWKMRLQAEAASICKRQRAHHTSPTKASLSRDLAKWCRDNDVKTGIGVYPSVSYIRTHVLGKGWSMPP